MSELTFEFIDDKTHAIFNTYIDIKDLKTAIRAAGEHKQRITINVTIDGLRLRDERTGDSLYHHPVHKISFIAQDMTDSRAFGYIFGSPESGHRFFGIKTDKAASQVRIYSQYSFNIIINRMNTFVMLYNFPMCTGGSCHEGSLPSCF